MRPQSAEMKPVGVPARSNRRVNADLSVRVEFEGEAQQLEPRVVEEEVAVTVQLARELGGARPVPRVAVIVLAPRVVQQPEREHDLWVGAGLGGQVEPGRSDREPVRLAVQR